MRMWTTTSAVSRLESGRDARPTLDMVEKYALAVGARVEIRVGPGWYGDRGPTRTMAPANDRFRRTNRSPASGRERSYRRDDFQHMADVRSSAERPLLARRNGHGSAIRGRFSDSAAQARATH